MADLIVSFGRYIQGAPIASGDEVRTEIVTIGGSSEQSSLSANTKDRMVHLEAGADCWVAIGTNPTAESPDNTEGFSAVWPMKTGTVKDFSIEYQFKVAVIQM